MSRFVTSHQDVVREAGAIKNVYPETSMMNRTDLMPVRYVVSVIGAKTVYAVVDVSRSAGKARFTLACVSRIPSGSRDPRKDVCAQ